MTRRRSVHVGLTRVAEDAYRGGWRGFCRWAAQDAQAMHQLASAAGFDARLLLTEQATRAAVAAELADAARTLTAGDLLVWTYAGHGARLPDQGDGQLHGGDEPRDQAWCLSDGFLLDDEVRAHLAGLAPGVRVLVVCDCCFSGTMTVESLHDDGDPPRAMPPDAVDEAFDAQRAHLDPIRARLRAERPAVAASVLLLAACGQDAFAFEGKGQGKFTAALLDAWAGGAFAGDHHALRAAIEARTGPRQVPVLFLDGARDPAFEAAIPFTGRAARP